MSSEVISNLVGKLSLDIDGISKLQAFERKLQNVAKKMQQFSKQWEQLGKQMSKSLGVVDQAKQLAAKEKWIRALERELRAEKALEAQRRKTFQAELKAQQKLKAAGTKAAHTSSPALAAKQAAAVQAAKQQNAAQPKKRGRPASNTSQASAAQLHAQQVRQARLQAIHAKTQANSQKAQIQFQQHQTKLQRLQAQLLATATQTQHNAAMSQIRMQRQQVQLANITAASQQRAGRYAMAQQRHQHWLATRGSNNGSGGPFSVVGAFTGGLGVATAALYALGKGIGYANERIEKRQEAVIDTQNFNSMFTAISPRPELQKLWRDDFLKAQVENGGEVSIDTAKDFRNFAMSQLAYGKSRGEINQQWDLRQKAFTIGGLTSGDAKELNKQLGQMAGDGTGSKADYDIIQDRFPMLTPYLVKAYAAAKRITDQQKALTSFNKDLKAGKGVQYSWYQTAMNQLVSDNPQILADRKNTVAYAKQQRDNQQFLIANGINTNAELDTSEKNLLRAQQDLADAMIPVNEQFRQLDIGLTNFKAALINRTLGKNDDGTAKTPEQMAQDMASRDGSLLLPVVPDGMGISTKLQELQSRKNDPIDRFWRSQRQEQELDQKIAQLEEFQKSGNWGLAYAVPPIAMTFGDEDHHWTLGKDGPSFTPDQIRAMSPPIVPQVANSFLPVDARPSIPSVTLTPESIQAVVAGLIGAKPDVPASGVMAPDITVHQTINIDADVDSNSVKQKLGPMLKSEAQNALRDMLGRTRAQQAERR